MRNAFQAIFNCFLRISCTTLSVVAHADVTVSGTVSASTTIPTAPSRDINQDLKIYGSLAALIANYGNEIKEALELKSLGFSAYQQDMRASPLTLSEPESVFELKATKEISNFNLDLQHTRRSYLAHESTINQIGIKLPNLHDDFEIAFHYGRKNHDILGMPTYTPVKLQSDFFGTDISHQYKNFKINYSQERRWGEESIFEMYRNGAGSIRYLIPMFYGQLYSDEFKSIKKKLELSYISDDLNLGYSVINQKQTFGCVYSNYVCSHTLYPLYIEDTTKIKSAYIDKRLNDSLSVKAERIEGLLHQDNQYSATYKTSKTSAIRATYNNLTKRFYGGLEVNF